MHDISCREPKLRGSANTGPILSSFGARYFCSMSVENLTEPSSMISTRGAVPRIPMVPTGVATFMLPVCEMLPAMKVNVPFARLSSVEFE